MPLEVPAVKPFFKQTYTFQGTNFIERISIASWMINTDSYLITLITGIQVHDKCRFKVCMAWPPLTIRYILPGPVNVLALAYKHFFSIFVDRFD